MIKHIAIFPIYLIIINIIAVIFTITDKKKAINGSWRIKERTLISIAFLGGAIGEYFSMLKIHHKTRHKKFMIGLPFIIFIQIISLIFLIIKVA